MGISIPGHHGERCPLHTPGGLPWGTARPVCVVSPRPPPECRPDGPPPVPGSQPHILSLVVCHLYKLV